MQKFFDQIKVSLAKNITCFSSTTPGCVYIELQYRDQKVEIDYDSVSGGSEANAVIGEIEGENIGPTFVLSIDLGSDLELEILPHSAFDRLFDIQADVSLFAKKIKIKSPSIKDELVVHANNEALARNFLGRPDVSKIVNDYGVTFFKIENGELKVYLDQLSSQKFEELKSNPDLINKYLDVLVDVFGFIKNCG